MRVRPTSIPDVCIVEPDLRADARGVFFESYNRRDLEAALGRPVAFVQDNHSVSTRNVLRGLHYQLPTPQAKLVRVVRGEIFDVAVDLRRGSPTFGRWTGQLLSAGNRLQVWIPEGFAHGCLALSDVAEVLYKTTDYYRPEHEHCLRWDDPDVAIDWPRAAGTPILSARDAGGCRLTDAAVFGPGGS